MSDFLFVSLECMDEYEKEFEAERASLDNQVKQNDQVILKLEAKLQKMEADRSDYKKEASTNEREVEKL